MYQSSNYKNNKFNNFLGTIEHKKASSEILHKYQFPQVKDKMKNKMDLINK